MPNIRSPKTNRLFKVTLILTIFTILLTGFLAFINTRQILGSTTSSLQPYGVNDWAFTDNAMTAMKTSGITWARVMVNWNQIEPTQGSISWNKPGNSNIDWNISQAQKYGITVTVSVFNAPSWARQPGLVLPQPNLYANFVTTLLNRYPGKIAAVEVLNEENTGTWPDTQNRDARLYIPILQSAYRAVKSTSPTTLVATSGMWGTPNGYLEDLYTLGGKDYFDIINFHYYPSDNAPSASYTWWISNLRQIMTQYGEAAKPIWVTEFGWHITDENRPNANIVTPQQQTEYIDYLLRTSMQSGYIQKVFPYIMRGDHSMALMHATNNFNWNYPQPPLASSIPANATSLTVTGNWTKHWPTNGTIIIDKEQMDYSSLALSGSNTLVQGLKRGTNSTTAADHASGTTAYNLDETANFKRKAYFAYTDFISTYPTWELSNITSLPDVPLAASKALAIVNPGFENNTTGWFGSFTVDQTQYNSGKTSAKITNSTGRTVQASQRGITVEAGKSYYLNGWVKIAPDSNKSMNAMINVNLQDSSGKFITTVPGNYYIYGTNGVWRQIHYAFRTPSNAAKATIYLVTTGGTGTAWFDDINANPHTLQ